MDNEQSIADIKLSLGKVIAFSLTIISMVAMLVGYIINQMVSQAHWQSNVDNRLDAFEHRIVTTEKLVDTMRQIERRVDKLEYDRDNR